MMWLSRPASSGSGGHLSGGQFTQRAAGADRAPDPTLTPVSGMLAVSELCERLDVTDRLDGAIGPIKRRCRGHTAGEVLVGSPQRSWPGRISSSVWDRQGADAAGQQLAPVPERAATTAAGLARRFTVGQWAAVETGLGDVAAAALAALPARRVAGRGQQGALG